jgi:hypothetical protein
VSTEAFAQFVTRGARQLVAHFFFRLLTLPTSCEFPTLGARKESPRTEALEDDHHGHCLVPREGLMGRAKRYVGEHSFVGITLATIHHVNSGPTADEIFITLVATTVQQRGRRDHRRAPQGRLVAAAPFAQHRH